MAVSLPHTLTAGTAENVNHVQANDEALRDGVNAVTSAWSTWSPTWTNLTVGNGTVSARYKQVGNLVVARLAFTLGSTSAVSGSVAATLPAAAQEAVLSPLGNAVFRDTGTETYVGVVHVHSSDTSKCEIQVKDTSGTYAKRALLSSTVPFTWTTGDILLVKLVYEST